MMDHFSHALIERCSKEGGPTDRSLSRPASDFLISVQRYLHRFLTPCVRLQHLHGLSCFAREFRQRRSDQRVSRANSTSFFFFFCAKTVLSMYKEFLRSGQRQHYLRRYCRRYLHRSLFLGEAAALLAWCSRKAILTKLFRSIGSSNGGGPTNSSLPRPALDFLLFVQWQYYLH